MLLADYRVAYQLLALRRRAHLAAYSVLVHVLRLRLVVLEWYRVVVLGALKIPRIVIL